MQTSLLERAPGAKGEEEGENGEGKPSLRNLNHNVKLTYLYTFFSALGIGVWGISTLSAYVYRLTNDSTVAVGNVEAAQGAAQLLAAPVCGLLADRVQRATILRVSALLALATVGGGIFVILVVRQYYFLYPVLCGWGVFSSLQGSALEAILADSTTNQSRAFYYSWRQFLQQMGLVLGPVVSAALYATLGNHWGLDVLEIVMCCGLGMCAFASVFLFFFSDAHALQEASESVLDKPKGQAEKAELCGPGSDRVANKKWDRYGYVVPWVLLVSTLVCMAGAGMTVKFFPIFFLDDFGVSPIALNITYAFVPFTTALLVLAMQSLATRIGRLQTVFLSFAVGIGCLVCLAELRDVRVLLPVFVARGAFANSVYPLERAVLMEHVRKKHRGKWGAMESLIGTFWTGSAALGGYVVHHHGFRVCYLVTALIYFVSIVPFLPLMLIVPK